MHHFAHFSHTHEYASEMEKRRNVGKKCHLSIYKFAFVHRSSIRNVKDSNCASRLVHLKHISSVLLEPLNLLARINLLA